MQTAARVAKVFSQDPVAMLDDGGDDFITHVRLAAVKVVQRDEAKQQEEQNRNAKRPSRSRRR